MTRVSAKLTDKDVEEALYAIPCIDERYEEEIKEYLLDLIENITTGDEEYDNKQIDIYAEVISKQQACDIEQIRENLYTLRKEYY